MQDVNDKTNPQTNLRDVFNILYKHKKKIVFFFITVMGIAAIITASIPNEYRSEAKLFLKVGREIVPQNTDSPGNQRTVVSQSQESQINTEIEILTSNELALKTVRKLGMASFQKNSPKDGSPRLPVFDKLPETIKHLIDLSKKSIAGYLFSSDKMDGLTEDNAIKKIARQFDENLEARVVGDSNIIKLSYKSQSPKLSRDVLDQLIVLYLEKHMQLLATPESFQFFKKESDRFRLQLEATEKKIQALKDTIGEGYTTSKVSKLNDRLQSLNSRKQNLLSTFTETSIPVSEVRHQIRQTENELEKELKSNNSVQIQLAKLEREKELQENNYRRYSETLEQTRIDQALDEEKISNIRIAQAPYLPQYPIGPPKKLFLILSFFMALFGGLGLAFFVEYFDNSLEKPEDVEAILELPVLGSIRKMSK